MAYFLLAIGLLIIAGNYYSLVEARIRGEQTSLVLFLGGILSVCAVLALGVHPLWALLPLVLDVTIWWTPLILLLERSKSHKG